MARGFTGDSPHLIQLIREGIRNKGFSFIDILQPCVSFNKLNTYDWFKGHTYYLDSAHDPTDRATAFRVAVEEEKMALGVIYVLLAIPLFVLAGTIMSQSGIAASLLRFVNAFVGHVRGGLGVPVISSHRVSSVPLARNHPDYAASHVRQQASGECYRIRSYILLRVALPAVAGNLQDGA